MSELNDVDEGIVTIMVDTNWWMLPLRDDDQDASIERTIEAAQVDEEAARGLRYGLKAVNGIARSLPAGERHNYALVRTPESGLVEALLSTRVSRVGPTAYDDYLDVVQNTPAAPDVEVLNRRIIEVTMPRGRGILVHDLTLALGQDGVPDPALERAFLALFVADTAALIEFTLITQDLALFEDIESYLMEFAAGDNPAVPGEIKL